MLLITKIYSGFQRDDGRNWLGFHDGVSNIERNERLQDISIDDISNTEDIWIMNGTYLGFIRTEFNLKNWWKINASDQSIVIGREKITGCPLIGVDKNNNPVKDRNCPIPGTFEVIEPGNELYLYPSRIWKSDISASWSV